MRVYKRDALTTSLPTIVNPALDLYVSKRDVGYVTVTYTKL